jgi:2-polyprenyl-6-methoxyphenol hydroxylase-like FAD-dependent oxidoreductase
VLVAGAGAAGTATAILLAEAGLDVDLIDIQPTVTAIGSGITLQGNALRGDIPGVIGRVSQLVSQPA